jgi:hypothetical protein
MTFIDEVRLDVIATFHGHDQALFNCAVTEEALESEDHLIGYIKEQLKHDDLAKLSLCWYCPENIVDQYETIQNSIEKNAKYYFEGK